MEAACALVDKLITENAELVEKVINKPICGCCSVLLFIKYIIWS